VTGDCPHKQRRHAIADLLYSFLKLTGKHKLIREGPESLELGKGKPALLIPMHCPSHSQVAVHAPDRVGGFPGIEPDGVESVPRDVLLGSADPDPIPVPVSLVFPPGLQQLLQLIWRRRTPSKRVAACDRRGHWSWMEFHKSSRTPMKIILCRDCGTPKYMAFISLAET